MERNRSLSKKSMDYVPTWDEAGVPENLQLRIEKEWEDPIKNEKNEKELLYYIDKYQLKHREKLRLKELELKEKQLLKMSAHWYKTLMKEELENLIEDSRAIAEETFDSLRENIKATWELNYIEMLRYRVKHSRPILNPASEAKLRRFPQYDFNTKSLYGSDYAFYRLWAHCFPSPKNVRTMRSTRKY